MKNDKEKKAAKKTTTLRNPSWKAWSDFDDCRNQPFAFFFKQAYLFA